MTPAAGAGVEVGAAELVVPAAGGVVDVALVDGETAVVGDPAVVDALAGRWNSGYQRCLDEVRRLMTDMPADLLNQRLVFMGGAIGGILAGRETELSDRSREHPMWSHPDTLGRVAHALASIIED